MSLYPLVRPFVFAFDAERAHRLSLAALKLFGPHRQPLSSSILSAQVAGLRIPNPVGLAAGYDKDAEVPLQMLGTGFGFVEVGTLTPLPQAGNPQPRLFRLVEDKAVINRMGLNNGGQAAALARLQASQGRGLIGVN
ncbi:MAG: dihydroorotate dehydrogenase (quinone), partial [Alphaproteobacteria bacterium PA3]